MPVRAIARRFAFPAAKPLALLALAGAALFTASTAHADPRHGGRERGWRGQHHGSHHHRPDYGRSHHRDRSGFTLNISSGRPYYGYGRPYYTPSYPVYYRSPVIVTPAPIVYNNVPVSYQSAPALMQDGRYCREYTQQVYVGGRMQESYGRACMQPDGAWQIDS